MSGIAILRRLLMKQAMKESAPFQHEGIMSISKTLSGNVDAKVKRWIDSAKRQGADIDKMSEQEIKYILELNKPKPIRAISADSPEGEILTRDLFNMLDRRSGKNVIKTDFGGGITDSVTETIAIIKSKKPIDAMKEANKVLKGEGRYKSLSKADRKKIVNDESVTDHIFERNIIDETEDFAQGGRSGSGLNYLLGEDDQNSRVPYSKGSRKESWTDKLTRWGGGPSVLAGELGFEGLHQIYNLLGMGGLYAEGGRTGFGLGGMSRRAFLKLMGGAAATGAAAKTGLFGLLKAGKPTIVKDLTSVPIKNISGMPAWFKPLVNKVIKEGEEISSHGDRIITHKATLPNSKTDIYITQDLNSGDVVADIGMGKHGWSSGHLGQPVRLEYKASEVIEPTHIENIKSGSRFEKTGKPTKTKEEFWVEEAEFTGGHPENVKFEESTFEKFGEHGSNFDEVEKFATGKVKTKTGKAKIKAEREHWVDDRAPEADDFASGGRVPFIFGGGAIKNVFRRLKDVKKIPHGEKVLKKNTDIQHLLSSGDKQQLKELETQFSEQILLMLKKDRELMLQLQSNKAMQDEGLDFLMKKMEEDFAPHIKKYKSIEEIDEAILNMENIIKNKAMKEGRRPHAIGGRVSISRGYNTIRHTARTILQKLRRRKKEKKTSKKNFMSKDSVDLDLF